MMIKSRNYIFHLLHGEKLYEFQDVKILGKKVWIAKCKPRFPKKFANFLSRNSEFIYYEFILNSQLKLSIIRKSLNLVFTFRNSLFFLRIVYIAVWTITTLFLSESQNCEFIFLKTFLLWIAKTAFRTNPFDTTMLFCILRCGKQAASHWPVHFIKITTEFDRHDGD